MRLIRRGYMRGSRCNHPLYRAWCHMRERCKDKKRHNAKHYEHVSVCERWENSFEAFVEDMPPKPSPRHTIDRIDGTKGYEPGNVRWATAKEQAENRKSTVWVEYNGERVSVSEMCRRAGVDIGTYKSRLKRGWSHDDAIKQVSRCA